MDISQYSVIDFDELDANTMSNRGLQRELFNLFFEQSTQYVADLRTALADGNQQDWKMVAHGVKGAALSLGFIRLSRIAGACQDTLFSAGALAALEAALNETREAAQFSEAA